MTTTNALVLIESADELTRVADAFEAAGLGGRLQVFEAYQAVNWFSYPGTVVVHFGHTGNREAFLSAVESVA